MDQAEAIGALQEGHTVWSEEFADQVCHALGVKPKPGVVMHSDPPGTFKGLTLKPEFEGTKMVAGLDLAIHVALAMGLDPHGRISGRGSRARAISEDVKKFLDSER